MKGKLMRTHIKYILFVTVIFCMMVLVACPVKKDASRLVSIQGVVEGERTPFEPTNTPRPPGPTSTPRPQVTIMPWKSPTPTNTRLPTRDPGQDCGIHIFCTATPTRQSS